MADIISVSEIAKLHSRHCTSVHKIINKHGISAQLLRSEDARGQKAVHISIADYELHRSLFESAGADEIEDEIEIDWAGFMYIMQLEPKLDPGRYKIGFAANVEERLCKHRASAPFATPFHKWRCKLLWEKTAIESITRDCEKLYTEVFRTSDISRVMERGDRFFDVMPNLTDVTSLDDSEPLPLIRSSGTFSP